MPIQTFSGVIANQSTLLVNARELHERLQICTRFDIWIQRRISEYNFVENLDFIERSTLNNRGFFKTETKDYHLTLDMAKELCTRSPSSPLFHRARERSQTPCRAKRQTTCQHSAIFVKQPRPNGNVDWACTPSLFLNLSRDKRHFALP